jgi:DNA-binding SARP family transcriptional activator/predicted ATPase
VPRLSVYLLGPFCAALDGQPLVGFESDKVRALLAYLMVESERPHRREELVGLLWPERPESVARQNLSQALSNLRHVIRDRTTSPPFLEISRQALQFSPESDHELDTLTFLTLAGGCSAHAPRARPGCPACADALARAVAVATGPFLVGFSLKGCPAFEEWALQQRERFEQLTIRALRHLSGWHIRRGATEQAVAYTRRWLALDPWQEQAHRQLMGILARSGQRTAALEQYEACRAVLHRELGVEPVPETRRLYTAIRNGLPASGAAVLPSSPDMPVPILPLLGREAELDEIEVCLGESGVRLLSLVGPGGSGKTHLALEAAFKQGYDYADGVTVVSLAAVQTADAIVPAIAQACGLSLQPGRPAAPQLLDYLREKELLLLLDNVEQLLTGQLLTRPSLTALSTEQGIFNGLLLNILRTASRVRILTTSRVRLNLGCERLLNVGGLPCPQADDEEEALSACPSVQLFLATARRVRSPYDPDGEDLRAIAALCHLLSGMPLAIVLAASWMEVLGPGEILQQVRRRTDFLETEWEDLPPRQRSMRAVMDHSWSLLAPREQQLFAALSAFHGGFSAAAAGQVTGVSTRDLMRLSGKSVLMRTPGGRYAVHELLRQYAEEKLADAAASVREHHSAYYLTLAQQCGEGLRGPRQAAALAELEAEVGNLRVAWDWAVARAEITPLQTALDGLCRFFERCGRCEEGLSLCSSALDRLQVADHQTVVHDERRRLRARLLAWQGTFERMAGRLERAALLAEQSLDVLAHVGGDTQSERAAALRVRGETAYRAGDRRKAQELYLQSLSLFQALGDARSSGRLQCDLGEIALMMGRLDEAERWLEASLQQRRAVDDHAGIAEALLFLGNHASAIGNQVLSDQRVHEAIGIFRELGDEAGVSRGNFFLACTNATAGKFREALDLGEERVRFTGRLGQRSELAWAESIVYTAQMHLGMVSEARATLASAMAYFRESGDMEGQAVCNGDLASLAMLADPETGTQANPEAAYRYAERSVNLARALEHIDQGLAWARLSYAAHRLGRSDEAQRHLCEALHAVTRSGEVSVLHAALAHLAAILSDSEPERAVEVYAVAIRHPYVGNSRLWQDLLGSQVAVAAARLSPDVVSAAQRRGRDQDATVVAETWLTQQPMVWTDDGDGR